MFARNLVRTAGGIACLSALMACGHVVKQEVYDCRYRGNDCHREHDHDAGEEEIRSDIRLKEDIRQIGTADNGLPIYLYHYKGEQTWRIGVMAQDVMEQSPEAVSTGNDGFYAVNYGRIAW